MSSIYRLIKFHQKELDLSITIPKILITRVIEIAKAFYPNETGGVFVGQYSDDQKEARILEILMPNKIISSPGSFVRIPDNINSELERLYRESQGKLNYIGEWHSHPHGPPSYSNVDHQTMKSITNNPKIKIDNPLLGIFYRRRFRYDCRFYVYYENRLFKFIKE